jgi:glycosyltransferase involved in cell wall biosynthesis
LRKALGKEIKVVHVCLNKSGGAAAAAWRLHQALLEGGVNSWFYTLEPRSAENPAQQWICWKEATGGLFKRARAFAVRKYWQWRTAGRKRSLDKIARQLETLWPAMRAEMVSLPDADKNILEEPLLRDADIIHLHWVALFLKQHEFFRRVRGRHALCWTFHDLNPISGIFHYRFDLERNMPAAALEQEVIAYKLACLHDYGQPVTAIAPNKWMLQQISNSHFAGCFHPVEIPYCQPAMAAKPINRETARNLLGIAMHKVVMLAVVERVSVARKQADLVLKLAESFPDVQWEIVGHAAIDYHSLPNVSLRGFVHDRQQMQWLYTAADALVITSAEDNLPNVMLEAFACGTPVLSFAVGGMQQYVLPGISGQTTHDLSTTGFLELVRNWLSDPQKPAAEKIRQFAQQHFGAEKVAAQHLELYQHLLATTSS